MNPVFIRNFVIFTLIMAASIFGLVFYTIKSSQDIEFSDRWIFHSQSVIREAQNLTDVVLDAAASQRNYIILKTPESMERFEGKKTEMSTKIAELRELVKNSATQSSRLTEIEHVSLQYKDELDQQTEEYKYGGMPL